MANPLINSGDAVLVVYFLSLLIRIFNHMKLFQQSFLLTSQHQL